MNLVAVAALGMFAFSPATPVKVQYGYQNIQSYEELEQSKSFSFSIISDNHGASPIDNIEMARMSKWVADSKDAFVLGVGDHLQKNKQNDFLAYILRNNYWKQHFYPTIADSENDYFGKGEGDWGSGRELLNVLGFKNRLNVEMNANGAEYYAKMVVNEVVVHYIVLHFPDNPGNSEVAFPESSKQFLINTLNKIQKSNNDIIIVSAHSMYGSWIDYLSKAQQNIVNKKCDLLLAGTTHFFERRVPEGLENSGPLMVSAGSVNEARWGSKNGFLQVHVMKNPLSLIVQYVNTNDSQIQLQDAPYSFVKYINGGVFPLSFPRPVVSNNFMTAISN